jgi:5-methylcytosine-specific restriction enzyme B
MSKRLKNIFTYLVQNRKHQLNGWHSEYKKLLTDIQKIKEKLNENDNIRDIEIYKDTSFENFDSFIKNLLYDVYNGVSSRGQSVLSGENLQKFKSAVEFDRIIVNIIKDPSLSSYQELQNFWREQNVGFNPVLINRALATCSIGLTSTVDEGKFNEVFYWLQNENIIPKYSSQNQDWYSKNIFVMLELKKQLDDIPEIDDCWISLFYWEMYVNLSNPFSLKKQIVKYGSPGTGKTFTVKQTSKLQFEIWKNEFAENDSFFIDDLIETVQFHPSYTYEDFMEGLRPILDNDNKAQLSLENGIFKSFCIQAGKWECDVIKLNIEKNWNEITLADLEDHKEKLIDSAYWNYVFQITDKTKKIADAVPPYFMIIDEINRAELSRVFGELMLCLEYRGIKGAVKTQYAELNNEKTGMIKLGGSYKFFIPNNVYVLGTMNTIDRSVESFDFALRRRFKWEEVEPDISLLRYHLVDYNKSWIALANNLSDLNEEIAKQPLLGKDYRIGHAYLWEIPYSKQLTINEVRKSIWEESISPLLAEYLRGTGRDDLIQLFEKKFGL